MISVGGQCRYLEGVDGERVVFRAVGTGTKKAQNEDTVPIENVANDDQPAYEIRDDTETAATVPTSITCNSHANSNKPEMESSGESKNMREGAGEDPMARSVNDRSLPTAQSIATTSMATASQYGTLPGLEMKIPAWLQRDRESQRNLFCESSSFCSTCLSTTYSPMRILLNSPSNWVQKGFGLSA